MRKICVALAALTAAAAFCDLPSNLVPANWVESKGGYIKTGVTQSGATTVELDCLLEVTSLDYSKRRLMGFDGAGPKNYFGVTTNNHFEIWNPTAITAVMGVKYRLNMTQDKTTTLLEVFSETGEPLDSVTGNARGINSSECQIFTINSSSAYTCYGIRVYDFKVIIDGDVKRDLVPVYDVSEGKAGMYDSVSETTYFAYGSGKIVCDAFRFQYGSGDTKIVCDEGCMYFPAHVSFSDLSLLKLDAGTTLSGTAEGKSLAVGTDPLDMTEIFGEMEPGVKYDLKIDYPSGFRTNFFIAKSANIAALYVTLDGHDIAYLNRSKKNEAAGAVMKIKPDGTSSGLLQVKKIAGRGNATWTYSGDKKPYKLNLNEKYALIEGVAKSKKFALLSLNLQDRKDRSGLKEWIAHELADAMVMNFNPGMEFVDLYINGSYRGFYLLKERVTIDSKRININKPDYAFEDEESTTRVVQKNGIKGVGGASGDADDIAPLNVSSWNIPSPTETVNVEDDSTDPALAAGIQSYQYATNSRVAGGGEGGAVVEMNVCYGVYCQDEHSFFITRRGQIYTMKEPELATKEQVLRIAIFGQEYEDALFDPKGFNSKGRHYSDYINVASMAKHLMLDGFLCNSDFCILSTFFYIDADPVSGEFIGKLIAEPVWD
ncbi:CotH kinase family protein, partial [bacterium]|nr:CotH kinase family protein [bacterium]